MISGVRLTKLRDITSKIGSGATPLGGAASYKSSGIPLIRSMNVYDLSFERSDLAYIDEDQAALLDNVELQKGDVLLNITGASVARCCDLPDDLAGGRVNQHVAILRPIPELLDGKFLSRLLVCRPYKELLLSVARSGATREALTKTTLEDFGIELPSLAIQSRIADILSAYDDLIEVNTRRIAVLEEMARRLFDEWFVRMRFPGVEREYSPQGKLPPGWKMRTLGEVCTLMQAGMTPPRRDASYWNDARYDWFTTGELQDCFLEGSKEQVSQSAVDNGKTRLVPPGTILMAIYGSPTVGRLGVTTRPSCSNQAALAMRPNTDIVGQWYLYSWLMNLRDYFNNRAQGAAQQNISKEKVAAAPIVIPHHAAIARYEEISGDMRETIRVLTITNSHLKNARDLLLPKLISGEIDLEQAERDADRTIRRVVAA